MRALVYALALSFLATSALATTGFDASQAISTASFQCMKSKGYAFFIARVWESGGRVDETGIQNIKNAKAAGIQYTDGYIFPCVPCGNPAGQIKDTVDRLNAEGVKPGMLWLDIEKLSWSSNLDTNRNFIQAMANELHALGINYGVYASAYMWSSIVGDWTALSSRPLWFADYDNVASLGTFKPFGGWGKAAMKQYAGDYKGACGLDIDLNYY